jgi:hypothetical protein
VTPAPTNNTKGTSGDSDTGVWAGVKRNTVGAITGLYHAFTAPATDQERNELAAKVDEANANGDNIPLSLAYDPSRATLAYHRLIDAPADVLNKKGQDEQTAAHDLLHNGQALKGAGMYLSGLTDRGLAAVPLLGPAINSIAQRYESGDTSGAATDLAAAVALENAKPIAKVVGSTVGKVVDAIRPPLAPEAADAARWTGINQTIGAPASSVRIGRAADALQDASTNPGRGLDAAGLDADTLKKMPPLDRMKAAYPAWQDAGRAVGKIIDDSTNGGTTLDAGKSAQDVFKRITNPDIQQTAIDQFNKLARETGITNQRTATPAQVQALRQSLTSGARFGPTGDLSSLAGVRAQLYRAVSGDLHDAIPGLGPADQHYSDLESAMKVLQSGAQKGAVTVPPTTMQKVGDFAKKYGPLIGSAVGGGGGVYGLHSLYKLYSQYVDPRNR